MTQSDRSSVWGIAGFLAASVSQFLLVCCSPKCFAYEASSKSSRACTINLFMTIITNIDLSEKSFVALNYTLICGQGLESTLRVEHLKELCTVRLQPCWDIGSKGQCPTFHLTTPKFYSISPWLQIWAQTTQHNHKTISVTTLSGNLKRRVS
jgi:hypothetical protein